MPLTETGTIALLPWLVMAAVVGIPFARIFHRAGFSWAWALISLLTPIAAMLILWTILAARRWTWREAS